MKVFQCKVCNKDFKDKSKLRRHQLVHTGERPFRCPYCEKSFSVDFNLKTHIRIHTGEKPYKCPYPGCDKAFTQAGNLNTHKAIKHGMLRHEKLPLVLHNEQDQEHQLITGSLLDVDPALLSDLGNLGQSYRWVRQAHKDASPESDPAVRKN